MRTKNGLIYLSDRSNKPNKPLLRKVFWIVMVLELFACLGFISLTLGNQTTAELFTTIFDFGKDIISNLKSMMTVLIVGHGSILNKSFTVGLILAGIFIMVVLFINPRVLFNAMKEAFSLLFLGRSAEPDFKDAELANRVTICDALQEYSDMIYQLCHQAGIRDVNFVAGKGGQIVSGEVTCAIQRTMDHNPKLKCETFESAGFVPAIYVDLEFMSRLRQCENVDEREDLIRFIFAHELIHVRNHDPMNLRYEWGIGGLLWLGAVMFVYDLFFLSIGRGLPIIVNAAMFMAELFLLVALSVLVDKGYWSQCQEFRADRFAALISKRESGSDGGKTSVFDTYEETEGASETEEDEAGAFDWLWSLGKTIKWFCSSGDVFSAGYEMHPSIKVRRAEIVRGEAWGITDYIRYAAEIRIRAIFGKRKKVV